MKGHAHLFMLGTGVLNPGLHAWRTNALLTVLRFLINSLLLAVAPGMSPRLFCALFTSEFIIWVCVVVGCTCHAYYNTCVEMIGQLVGVSLLCSPR